MTERSQKGFGDKPPPVMNSSDKTSILAVLDSRPNMAVLPARAGCLQTDKDFQFALFSRFFIRVDGSAFMLFNGDVSEIEPPEPSKPPIRVRVRVRVIQRLSLLSQVNLHYRPLTRLCLGCGG